MYGVQIQNLCGSGSPDWILSLIHISGGISVDFFSSGYLDVSVPPVRLINLWIQLMIVCRNTLGSVSYTHLISSAFSYRAVPLA